MAIGPFDTTVVIDRLKANVPAFKFVQGCADLAAAMANSAPQTPCAYVLLAAERTPQGGGADEAYVETLTASVSVVIAVRNYRTAELGGQVMDDLRTIMGATRGVIRGWCPAPQHSAFRFVGGRLENYTNATAWWQEAYSVNYFERVIPQP